MPQELLAYTPIYLIVGVYRLLTDEKLFVPIWKECRQAAKQGALLALLWVSSSPLPDHS
jgi:hypothetical protein